MSQGLLKFKMTWRRAVFLFAAVAFVSVLAINYFFSGRTYAVTDTFTTSGTWTVPSGVTSATMEAWGGGGAGSGETVNGEGGGGGAGGQYAVKNETVTPTDVYTVTVAGTRAGGTGAGSSGFDSVVLISGVDSVRAKGGAGGQTVFGGTGSTSGGVGDTVYAGGTGGNYLQPSANGGGGGGGAGSSGNGGNGSQGTEGTGTNSFGGNGGTGCSGNCTGNAGSTYGGGGGGASKNSGGNRSGGAGAAGYVQITYTVSNSAPAAPTLTSPSNSSTGASLTPQFTLRTTDANNDYLRYKIDVCSTSNCSSIVRTIDQTSSQTGWSGQDTQGSTAYVGNSVISSSTIATHTYQTPALSAGTQYWWRAYAIDPGGSNTQSSASSIFTFTTNASPAAPTLSTPSNSATGVSVTPQFQMRTTDAESDDLQYIIEVCSTSNCSSVVRTINQTSSQTGWSGQDQAGTHYGSDPVITNSTMAVHDYQAPALNYSTQYWWRVYAIDPNGTNIQSTASGIFSLTTASSPTTSDKNIFGGTTIQGGTIIGN